MTNALFTGYAPVHFACFRPIHDALVGRDDVTLHVSGGLRTKTEDGYVYDAEAMYDPFGLPPERILDVEEIRDMDVDVLFCANTKPIAPRSAGCRVQIFHGMSFRNRAVRPENGAYDHYLAIGPYMVRAFERLGIFPAGDPRLVEVGFPKTDRLLDGSLDRDEVLAAHGLTGNRPIVLYAPTGARNNSLERCGQELISRLVASDCCDLLVKPHDHPKSRLDYHELLRPLAGERMRLVRSPDVVPSMFIADVLITDASSVANEYALLDRPLVFVDVPELLSAAAEEDGRMDLSTWGRNAGVVAEDASATVAAVEHALADPEHRSEVRRALVDDLFFNPGCATPAAIDFLDREVLA